MNKEKHARKNYEELHREFDALRKKENVSLTTKVQYILCYVYVRISICLYKSENLFIGAVSNEIDMG